MYIPNHEALDDNNLFPVVLAIAYAVLGYMSDPEHFALNMLNHHESTFRQLNYPSVSQVKTYFIVGTAMIRDLVGDTYYFYQNGQGYSDYQIYYIIRDAGRHDYLFRLDAWLDKDANKLRFTETTGEPLIQYMRTELNQIDDVVTIEELDDRMLEVYGYNMREAVLDGLESTEWCSTLFEVIPWEICCRGGLEMPGLPTSAPDRMHCRAIRVQRKSKVAKKRYKVTITEILKKVIEADAKSPEEAEQIAGDGWKDNKYILGAEDFNSVSFDAKYQY